MLVKAERPLIIVGQGALIGENGAAVLAQAAKLAQDIGAINGEWNGFSVLHTAASRVGALDLGLVPGEVARLQAICSAILMLCSCLVQTNST